MSDEQNPYAGWVGSDGHVRRLAWREGYERGQERIRTLEAELAEARREIDSLAFAISRFQDAYNEGDDDDVNEAFDALGDAKDPWVCRKLAELKREADAEKEKGSP